MTPQTDSGSLEARKLELVEAVGPWTAHNVALGGGIYTIGPDADGDHKKIHRVVQLVETLLGRSSEGLRVLDLACLEGGYSMEFGLRGASVVGVEVRDEHIARADFARDALGLDNVEFVADDVRNVSADRYGQFDVVLCLGILYHLPARDLHGFVQRISEMTRSVLIVNTHISLHPWLPWSEQGHTFWGRSFLEHFPLFSLERRRRAVWSSIDNTTSFWLTRPSLLNMLNRVGYTTVVEGWVPYDGAPRNRVTLAAFKHQLSRIHVLGEHAQPASHEVPESAGLFARAWMWLVTRFAGRG